jgi:hypothetical protein
MKTSACKNRKGGDESENIQRLTKVTVTQAANIVCQASQKAIPGRTMGETPTFAR